MGESGEKGRERGKAAARRKGRWAPGVGGERRRGRGRAGEPEITRGGWLWGWEGAASTRVEMRVGGRRGRKEVRMNERRRGRSRGGRGRGAAARRAGGARSGAAAAPGRAHAAGGRGSPAPARPPPRQPLRQNGVEGEESKGREGRGKMVKINHSPSARASGLSQPRSSALLEPRRRLLSGARGSPGPGAGQRRRPDREPLRTCPCGGAATSQAAAAAAAAAPSGEGK